MIHNDHLGTPQKMTDSTGTVVWAADYKPFGEATIAVSTITNNLRFPGQYFDAETGLHYNYLRDYNPTVGRYIEPDLIGITGDINLYLYAKADSIRFSDPFGLDPSGGPGAQIGPVPEVCGSFFEEEEIVWKQICRIPYPSHSGRYRTCQRCTHFGWPIVYKKCGDYQYRPSLSAPSA
jgi:RHS repeat-associated protein